jgi:hypothetical protein
MKQPESVDGGRIVYDRELDTVVGRSELADVYMD